MAAVYSTNLGVGFMNSGGKNFGTRTAHSISEIVSKDTNRLLEHLNKEWDFGKQKKSLKKLSFKRDGMSCLLTSLKLVPFEQGQTKFFSRNVPTDPHSSPGMITLADGDEIHFGEGSDGESLGKGPLWKDEAEDDGCHRPSVTSEEFCDVLDAKLLSGKATLV